MVTCFCSFFNAQFPLSSGTRVERGGAVVRHGRLRSILVPHRGRGRRGASEAAAARGEGEGDVLRQKEQKGAASASVCSFHSLRHYYVGSLLRIDKRRSLFSLCTRGTGIIYGDLRVQLHFRE